MSEIVTEEIMNTATYKLSIDEYDRMIANGVLSEDARVELIAGEMHEMLPPGPLHEDVIDLLTSWSVPIGHKLGFRIRIQNSIGLPETSSAPQPDVAWVKERSYRSGRPKTKEVLLVIEVADSSLGYDRHTTGAIYGAAGVPEYWIVNVESQSIEVYRDPKADGYGSRQTLTVGSAASPLCAPEDFLKVGWLFGVEPT